LWQGHEIGPLVEDLRRWVEAAPGSRKWLLPDRIGEYPRLLDEDVALAAYAATARIKSARPPHGSAGT
jgi:hypothetical protein